MCHLSTEAELKLPQLPRDVPVAVQKEGAQGLLPLPVSYHPAGPSVPPGPAPQPADVANDSKPPKSTIEIFTACYVGIYNISHYPLSQQL